jgi:tetratricopeptide (TPR) repeat protein
MYKLYFLTISLCLCLIGCRKDWFEEKYSKTTVTPTTLKDMQALMDDQTHLNGRNSLLNSYDFAEVGADNYFLDDTYWQSISVTSTHYKNAYIFNKEIFESTKGPEFWSKPYKIVFYSNVALEGLSKILPSPSEQAEWNHAKGCALYIRSNAFFWIAQIYSRPYDKQTADKDLGIPIKESADIYSPTTRATISETYNRIILDLKEASSLLPNNSPYPTRPTKTACFALLARTYLTMEDYDNAGKYADSALQLNKQLMDYNQINSSLTFPILPYNAEVIMSIGASVGILITTRARVDTVLYNLYGANDLRKTIFFKDVVGTKYKSFNGSYYGAETPFGGMATDEMYLTRSECFARTNNVPAALTDLNALLVTRWRTGTFIPVTAVDPIDALKKILSERRKELCFRGIRWLDLRRLNKDPMFATTVNRLIFGITYSLPPNDPRYTYPIPDEVIQMTGMAQNPR